MGMKRSGRKKHVSYVIQVTDWNWDFHFGLSPRPEWGDYADYRHIQIRGLVLKPTPLKGRQAEFTWVPGVIDPKPRKLPETVGVLSLYSGALSANLQMPIDAVPPVLQMLLADRYKYIVVDGAEMFRREAFVWSYYLTGTYDGSED
jgi:hypothetical protein